MSHVLVLAPAVQQYAWGKLGQESEVAKLITGSDSQYKVNETQPYAELWMGTHAKGPNRIIAPANVKEETLTEYIRHHPECLGDYVSQKFGIEGLPFLFKVLSVNKSLSIQAHPTKEHAAVLHKRDSVNYPDDNHKPEMAIALTRFEGMCGFKPAQQILQHLHTLPELSVVIGTDNVASLQSAVDGGGSREVVEDALRRCFSAVMACDMGTLKHHQQELYHRLKHTADNSSVAAADALFLRLYSWFPDDVGCFVAYFLNHIILEPGEAMFLAPNLPHNYIYGDCIECMACSDNVVRAGLTPKYKDVDTLVSMLDYQCTPAEVRLYQPVVVSDAPHARSIYNPPDCPDFTVDRYQIAWSSTGNADYPLPSLDSASIALVISGTGRITRDTTAAAQPPLELHPGSTLFIPANTSVNLRVTTLHSMLIYRAYSSL